MKIILNLSDKDYKEYIKEYGIRKVKQAIESNIWEAMSEWDMDACIRGAIEGEL